VEEALDRLAEAVDRATSEQRDALRIVHGHGTGALRKAVREHLRASPFVSRVTAADDEDGGDGVTIAQVG
jgi:DNA mismatch repair protein MutS2